MPDEIVLSMRNICKSFPGVRALQNVDFALRKGEIHALMGENGAGKSTLIKVLTGVHPFDEGQVHIAGVDRPVKVRSPQEAQALGISTVYQEVTLCPNLTVAENLFIGRGKNSFVGWGDMKRKGKAILDGLGIPAKPTQQLASCSLAVQQMVAIARAVDMECKILILDEPTSSLDEQEVAKLFTLMRDLRARGVGIVFVTHFLGQVYEVCDRITVLRNGELVGTYETEALPRVELIARMMGKELGGLSELEGQKARTAEAGGTSVYEAEGISCAPGALPFGFHIGKGEINGFTGLLGSGRSESVRVIFGADRAVGVKARING
ncbi:MAG: sugar ABC transporter ATP-binding protein, partial [Clostridiales Family XIII bacterium]|nr:sugar ABC transporter ATP-binding protein [Clostridiales Family XIII bacterium]